MHAQALAGGWECVKIEHPLDQFEQPQAQFEQPQAQYAQNLDWAQEVTWDVAQNEDWAKLAQDVSQNEVTNQLELVQANVSQDQAWYIFDQEQACSLNVALDKFAQDKKQYEEHARAMFALQQTHAHANAQAQAQPEELIQLSQSKALSLFNQDLDEVHARAWENFRLAQDHSFSKDMDQFTQGQNHAHELALVKCTQVQLTH